MKKIFLFIDYRNQFYVSAKYSGASVDLKRLSDFFESKGYELIVKNFFEIDLRKENFCNEWILYQSVEDPGLFYKSYIEDIILALSIQGAKLIPDFKYFRAHHNKVFMELLRDLLDIPEIKNISSKSFGSFEDYVRSDIINNNTHYVLKPSAGSRSSTVSLLTNSGVKITLPYKISRTFTLENFKLWLKKIRTGKSFVPMSNNRSKFIVQNFIPGLSGDYRITIYGEKYYCVFRSNRKNDFRASGSGIVNHDPDLPNGILDFAKKVYNKINTPYIILDIGYTSGSFYLFEFQCLSFKPIFFEKSSFFHKQNIYGNWEKVFEKPDLEKEIVTSVILYINNNNEI